MFILSNTFQPKNRIFWVLAVNNFNMRVISKCNYKKKVGWIVENGNSLFLIIENFHVIIHTSKHKLVHIIIIVIITVCVLFLFILKHTKKLNVIHRTKDTNGTSFSHKLAWTFMHNVALFATLKKSSIW